MEIMYFFVESGQVERENRANGNSVQDNLKRTGADCFGSDCKRSVGGVTTENKTSGGRREMSSPPLLPLY
jgi:hypothetical protein